MFRFAADRGRQLGASRMEWEAEPNAVGFYERMGGRYLRDGETSFMLLEPGERRATETDERARLESIAKQTNSVVLVAEEEGRLVGYVAASGGAFHRNRHAAYVVIGIRRSHAGQGIGTQLLTRLEQWALANEIRRLELTVMAHNDAAVGLYRKVGFEIEGTRRAALVVDGELVDELWMAKLLPAADD